MTPSPVEIAAADGCVLRGQLWPAASDWVILLHDVGSDEDLDRWRPLVSSLLAESLSVLAVDLRGHGASDGEWRADEAVDDVTAIVRFTRTRGARFVVVVVAGASALSALWALERGSVDGTVLLSATQVGVAGGMEEESTSAKASPPPTLGEGPGVGAIPAPLPRGPGIPKLFIVGAHDREAHETTGRLRAASIGWALVVTLPTDEHGTALLEGTWLGHISEHILGFVRERRYLARQDASEVGAPVGAADRFLAQLGVMRKGDGK
ncbi:MAG: hypothetical protein QOF01_3123 [Thermomicrobiales bacterium]|nr:hypothetical protein [Thermomicrobiales bacterium]